MDKADYGVLPQDGAPLPGPLPSLPDLKRFVVIELPVT